MMKEKFLVFLMTLGVINVSGQTLYGDYRVLVNVSGNGFSHSTQIYFDDESWDPLNPPSYGWDPCCDALLILGNADQPQVFTEVVQPPEPSNNHRLSINGLPHLFEPTDVPLGFLPGTLAPYTFSFTHLYTLPQGVTVELEDLSLNVTQDLLLDSTYDTWGAASDDEERFVIHFYPSSITSEDIYDSSSTDILITVDKRKKLNLSGFDGKVEVKLSDLTGRLLFFGEVETANDPISLGNDLSGMVILELLTTNQKRVVKRIIVPE